MKIQLSDHFTYRRLLRFVFPSIVMMVFTSIYGVVDGLFVSNFVGKDAFASINLIMPFLMIFGGVGFMFGTGGSALVAMTLGEKKKERANEYFTMIVAGTAIVGAIISLIACFIMRPVAIWLGAEGEIITDCVIYGRIMMIFNIAFMLQNAFQGFFITAEKPHLGLVTTVAAGLTNMVLDALLVGVLKWGVAGVIMAALAFTLAGTLSKIFVGYDPELFAMTKHAFRIFSLAFIFSGFTIFASSFFTALNNGGVSAAISFLRTFIFKMAAVLIMPLIWKLDGIWWSVTIAEVFALIISVIFLVVYRKKYNYI